MIGPRLQSAAEAATRQIVQDLDRKLAEDLEIILSQGYKREDIRVSYNGDGSTGWVSPGQGKIPDRKLTPPHEVRIHSEAFVSWVIT